MDSLPENPHLTVSVTKILLCHSEQSSRSNYKHVFLSLSLLNQGDSPVKLLGRRWTLETADGHIHVFEENKVFNSRPVIQAGQIFAFSGVQRLSLPATVRLTILGLDDNGQPFRTSTVKLHVTKNCHIRPIGG